MRNLDYWLGIPLCFLLSGVNCIFKTTRIMKEKNRENTKVVFIKLSELGAIILSFPLLKRMRNEFPAAEPFFITFAKNKDIFLLLERIIPEKNILSVREDSLRIFVLDVLRLIRRLRKERIDIIFDLEFFSRFSSILAYLIGAEKRVGFYHYTFEGLYRGSLLTHKVQFNPLNHIAKTYLSLNQVLREREKNTPELYEKIDDNEIKFPEYVSDLTAKEAMQRRLSKSGITGVNSVYIINPGEGILPLREWPLENFIALALRILEDPNNYIIIAGTEKAGEKGKLLLKKVNHPRCLNFTGETTLRELMELFYISDALISNDCGLAHLAMLTPVKKFIIFGPESPRVFSPLGDNIRIIYSEFPCSPCLSVLNQRSSACADNQCLKAINSDYVYRLVSESLKPK